MKKYLSIFIFFASFLSYGQKSIYFSIPLPPDSENIFKVDSKHHGTYIDEKRGTQYLVNETGIYTTTIMISSISKETVREDAKYDVRNGYLFGVNKDSLPCILEEERYYFGIRKTTLIIGEGSLNVLTKTSKDQYILNIEEGENYTPVLIEFNGGNMEMNYFDYEPKTEAYNFINDTHTIEMNYFKLLLLEPTQKEYKEILKLKPFSDQIILKKEK